MLKKKSNSNKAENEPGPVSGECHYSGGRVRKITDSRPACAAESGAGHAAQLPPILP